MGATASVLRLGTRKSLLAWAQSGWVARELERLNPGIKVERVGIETRGDRIQDVSLQSVEGKEFFVAEIDEALRASKVDLTVHSMKDLSLERPAEFICGAVPRRENARDVVVFGPSAIDAIRSGRELRIGTSSPRRLENVQPFLARALPRGPGLATPGFRLVEIRGNVNTRVGRTQEAVGTERHLDGVVLAFAGLIRLWGDETARPELASLLRGARWMVLPARECPAAPGQGALAVECRLADARVREILSRLHDPASAAQAARERKLLADWGGGCHQRFGAMALAHAELGELLFVRGKRPDGEFVEELRWSGPSDANGAASSIAAAGAQAWDGTQWKAGATSKATNLPDLAGRAVFVAHANAIAGHGDRLSGARVWTSGVSSWFKLAEKGIWVEGCAEGLGFDSVRATLSEPVLSLPGFRDWSVLTHQSASEGWDEGCVIATYEVPRDYPAQAREALAPARDVYWASGSQFDVLATSSKGARHSCGPGKTAAHLRSKGVKPLVFPSAQEWRLWLNKKS